MAPPIYKLTYFNCKALGESIRFLFAYGGIEYEDSRFEPEEWPAIKPKMFWGKTPVLEAGGKTFNQSIAISRFLGKKVGLGGTNDWEDLQIDAIVYTITDFRLKMQYYFYDEDEDSKTKKKGALMNEIIPFYIPKFEETVKNNNGYLVNGKLTWADLFFAAIIDYCNFMAGKNLLENYPQLTKLCDMVSEIPAIKTWLANRPNIDM